MLDSMFPIACVLDTNYLVARLSFIKDLASIMPANVRICVPRIVINELDGLKNNSSTKVRARSASNYILQSLVNDTRKFVGQRLDEVVTSCSTNDDQILDYCIYLKRNGTPNVILLSSDRNLCIKSHLEDIMPFPDFQGNAQDFLLKLNANDYFFDPHTIQLPATAMHAMDIDTDDEIDIPTQKSLMLYDLLSEMNGLLVNGFQLCVQFHRKQSLEPIPSTLEELFQILIANKWGPTIDASVFRIIKDITRSIRIRHTLLTVGDIKNFIEHIYKYLIIFDQCNLTIDKTNIAKQLNTIFIQLDGAQ